jgi:hypothetical protein
MGFIVFEFVSSGFEVRCTSVGANDYSPLQMCNTQRRTKAQSKPRTQNPEQSKSDSCDYSH